MKLLLQRKSKFQCHRPTYFSMPDESQTPSVIRFLLFNEFMAIHWFSLHVLQLKATKNEVKRAAWRLVGGLP